MPESIQCPYCSDEVDTRGLVGHARKHGHENATKEEFMRMNANTEKPTTEAQDAGEVLDRLDSGEELVGVEDNAMIFRNEIIITDQEIKERVADALVERHGGTL